MKLSSWCQKDEKIGVATRKEYWKMEVGVQFSKSLIGKLEKQSSNHAKLFLKKFTKPRELYKSAVGSVVSEKTYKFHLELNEKRKNKICSSNQKYKGKKVCWPTWRQFVVSATDAQRKSVFDEFIKKSSLLNETIRRKFELSLNTLREYDLDPLTSYLEDHRMKLGKLKSVVNELTEGTQNAFVKQWDALSTQFLGRKPLYYDDYYFMRNLAYQDLVPAFRKVKPMSTMLKTMKTFGFSNKNITIDDKDRSGKYASPFCFPIKVPTDIRVSYKPENPLQTTQSIYHEMGHAMHESSIKKNLPYWIKYAPSEGLSETFSIFFEHLLQDKAYLTQMLKIPSEVAQTFIDRADFVWRYLLNFYAANSLFRIETWEKQVPFTKWDALYGKHTARCMVVGHPGEYWKLHHILPESMMYVPSYLLAVTNSFNVVEDLRNELGERWWNERKAGVRIKKFMESGSESPLGDFSSLKTSAFVKRYGKFKA